MGEKLPLITVTPYTIRVRDRHQKGAKKAGAGKQRKNLKLPFLPVQNFTGGGDIFSLFKTALLEAQDAEVQDLEGRKFVGALETEKPGWLDGWFKVGRSGYGSDFLNDGGKLIFKREKTHTEYIPLYFQLWCPDKATDYAVLTLQSFDRFSVKTVVNDVLLKAFIDSFPQNIILFSRLFDTKQAKKAIELSPIKKVRFIQKKVPKDQADLVRKGAGTYGGDMELVLRTTGDNPFGMREAIMSAIDGKIKVKDIVEIEEFNFQDLKVELEIGGKSRTMNIARADHLNTSFDISDEIELDDDSHPKLESIREYCSQLAQTLKP